MKIKLLSLILLSSCMLLSNNHHYELIIPSVNVNEPFWEFAGQPIAQSQEGAFAQVVAKWDDMVDMLARKLNNKIREDIGASLQQLDYYMEMPNFIDVYTKSYKNAFVEIFENEKEIDESSFNFVTSKLYYLQCNKMVKIYAHDTIPGLTVSFGADKSMHFILLNKNLYNAQTIDAIYQASITHQPLFFVMPSTHVHKSRVIEHAVFLHFGITQALSKIMHQGDYFSKLLLFLLYNQKTASPQVQSYGAEFVLFRSYLESCFQSKNPVELALFIEPSIDHFHQEFVLLWREFINDIKACYNADDLKSYEALSLKQRWATLYRNQDSDDDDA